MMANGEKTCLLSLLQNENLFRSAKNLPGCVFSVKSSLPYRRYAFGLFYTSSLPGAFFSRSRDDPHFARGSIEKDKE